jgi:hypothetical protein
VSKDTEAGAKAIYDTKSTLNGVSLEVGAKTYLVSDSYSFCTGGCALKLLLGQRCLRQGQDQQLWCPLPRLHPGHPTRSQGWLRSRPRHVSYRSFFAH